MLEVRIRFRLDDDWRELRPGDKTISVGEDELPAILQFGGSSARGLDVKRLDPVECFQPESARMGTFRWNPFGHDGEIAYGHVGFRVEGAEYFVNIKPSRLSEELWRLMSAQVQSAADALVTKWKATVRARLPRDRTGVAKKFSPAAAEVQISRDWKMLEGALARIARRPRSEIGVPRPARTLSGPDGLPEPVRTTDVYENRVVVGSVRKLSRVLQVIAQRAERSHQSDVARLALLAGAGKGAIADAKERVADARSVVHLSRVRHQSLSRLRRDLPQAQPAPIRNIHMTSRIRMHPDYYVVTKLCGNLGREKYAQCGRDLSDLSTRRASAIYEYWCVFALCSALEKLGYRVDLREVAQLVREDLFELEIRRHRPVLFYSADGTEELSLWYDRQATFVPREASTRSMSAAGWESFWKAGMITTPGLYGRRPWTPDFWFELRARDRVAVAPGDAIFDSVSEGAVDICRKASKVREDYVKGLVLVEASGRSHRTLGKGLVVFCGDAHALQHVEEKYDEEDTVFLPLIPTRTEGEEGREPIAVSEMALSRIEEFIQDMRSKMQ